MKDEKSRMRNQGICDGKAFNFSLFSFAILQGLFAIPAMF
jgi:hypothetical protein